MYHLILKLKIQFKRTLTFINNIVYSNNRNHHYHYHCHHPFITSLRKKLREDLFEGILVDQAAWALLLEAPVNQLDLLSGKPGGGCEGGKLLRLVSPAKSERSAAGAP